MRLRIAELAPYQHGLPVVEADGKFLMAVIVATLRVFGCARAIDAAQARQPLRPRQDAEDRLPHWSFRCATRPDDERQREEQKCTGDHPGRLPRAGMAPVRCVAASSAALMTSLPKSTAYRMPASDPPAMRPELKSVPEPTSLSSTIARLALDVPADEPADEDRRRRRDRQVRPDGERQTSGCRRARARSKCTRRRGRGPTEGSGRAGP